MDEYLLENMGRIFVRGRILSRKRGANIRPSRNSLSKTPGEYSSVDECYLFDGWFSRVFDKTNRIRAGCAWLVPITCVPPVTHDLDHDLSNLSGGHGIGNQNPRWAPKNMHSPMFYTPYLVLFIMSP